MRIVAVAITFALLSSAASAACIGSGTLRTCFDSSGNSYTISKFGNTTVTNGYNAGNGSSWSQNSTTFGNTTLHNGRAANGNAWNATEQNLGGTTTLNGTDSRGNLFHSTCTQFGCY